MEIMDCIVDLASGCDEVGIEDVMFCRESIYPSLRIVS